MDELFEGIGTTVCTTFVNFGGERVADTIGCQMNLMGEASGDVWTIGMFSCVAVIFMLSGGGFFFWSE